MEMAKENPGTGNKDIQGTPSGKTPGDRRPLGKGSEAGEYIDEFGRKCIGNECFTLAIDEQRQELVINIKPDNECITPEIIESIRNTIGKGARTVYEVESESRPVVTHTKYPGKPGTTQVEHLPKPK
jgi:hypothetical protein